MAEESKSYRVTVAGRINDAQFQQARVLARFLATENSNVTSNAIAMTESEWEKYVADKGRELGGSAFQHRVSPLIVINDTQYLGRTPEFVAWMKTRFGVDGKANMVLYNRMANRAYRAYIDGHKHPHCYFDISIGGGAARRVVFELFSSICPRTCENFRALCTGEKGASESGVQLHYKGTPFHRVVPGGWVQGGDIAGGHGDGGESVYGPTFADETFDVKHNGAGILAMANKGTAHTNNSQFFVSLAPLPFLNGDVVAFGRVVSGMRTLRSIERLPAENERPTSDAIIVDCGVFNGKVYAKAPAGVDESKLAEAKAESEDRVRTALYARIYNSCDPDGTDSASGAALADALSTSGGAVFRRLFVEGGTTALEEACRSRQNLTFEAFCARADDVYKAVHRGGVEFLVTNPFGEDSRSEEERRKFMDMRKPATKRELLYELFTSMDTSGDGKIDRVELITGLRSEDSLVKRHFPTHITELASWIESSSTSDKLTFDHFHEIASQALSLPGGRA